MRLASILAIAAVLMLPAAAQDASAQKEKAAKLMAADTNKDGSVTFEELKAAKPAVTQEQFKRLDRNGDGLLNKADRKAKEAPAPAKTPEDARGKGVERLKQSDTNHDGRVSPEEFKAAFPKAPADRFAKMDRNKDGALTKADFPHKPASDANKKGQPAMAAKLKQADTDGDGKVTFEEVTKAHPGFTKENFDRLDSNKDGVLSAADRRGKENAGSTAPKAGHGETAKKLMAADANGDGRVSWAEAQAGAPTVTQEQFNHLDRNEDGYLSKEDRAK